MYILIPFRNHKLPARLVADQESVLPDELQTLLNILCPLLGSACRPVQLTAYRLLLTIIPHLADYDLNQEKEGDDQKEEVSRSVFLQRFALNNLPTKLIYIQVHKA